MQLGMIGLGKMGANMTRRLLSGGHDLVVFDRNPERVAAAAAYGAVGAESPEDLAGKLTAPRAVWVMVPSGESTEQAIARLVEILEQGDTIIDGGNSFYKDTLRRAGVLAERGIHAVDVGTSGGIWGIEEGYSMMVGGEADAVGRLGPIFETLAPAADEGWGRVGPNGSGHFVKMVHNGVEYGLMEAYAEGFKLMRRKEEFGLDIHQVAEIWRTGSVVRSWLLDLAARALADNADLEGVPRRSRASTAGRARRPRRR